MKYYSPMQQRRKISTSTDTKANNIIINAI